MSDNFRFRRLISDKRAVTNPFSKKGNNLIGSSIALFTFFKMSLYKNKKEIIGESFM